MLTSKQLKELPKGIYTNKHLADIFGHHGLKSREVTMPVQVNKEGEIIRVVTLTQAMDISSSNIRMAKMRLNRRNSRQNIK